MDSSRARQTGLLTRRVGDQLVVYDQERHRLHTLNPTATLVWLHCDGQHTVGDLATLVSRELERAVGEDLILLTLEKLQEAYLLEGQTVLMMAPVSRSRRDFLKAAVAGAGALLPQVLSFGESTTAYAQTTTTVPLTTTTPVPTTTVPLTTTTPVPTTTVPPTIETSLPSTGVGMAAGDQSSTGAVLATLLAAAAAAGGSLVRRIRREEQMTGRTVFYHLSGQNVVAIPISA